MKKLYGKTKNNTEIFEYTIQNKFLIVKIIDFGATLTNISLKSFSSRNLILSYDNLLDYEKDTFYFGTTIGRCANRIRNAKFLLNKTTYNLDKNDAENCLHGGKNGYNKRKWEVISYNDTHITLKLFSPNNDQGFPGNLEIILNYKLIDNELIIEHNYHCDQETIVNLINHSYFNLDGKDTILNHYLKINSDKYCEIDNQSIPTGKILNVNKTMDFTKLKKIGEDINNLDLINEKGYNHNYCLNNNIKVAELYSSNKDIKLEIDTNHLGLQLYTGNYLNKRHQGVCLETQYYINAINISSFISPIVDKKQLYNKYTILRFNSNLIK